MNFLRALRDLLPRDVCADLRELPLDACEAQFRDEKRSMMCSQDRATIGRHVRRQKFLRARIAELGVAQDETDTMRSESKLYAMPPR